MKTTHRFILLSLSLFLGWEGTAVPKMRHPGKIIEDLKSKDSAKKTQAKQQLRTYRFKDVARAMADYADDPNPDMRLLMAQMLGELGGVEAARHLKKLFFNEKEAKVRRAILIQMTGILPEAKDALKFYKKVVLSDPNAELRFLSLVEISLLDRRENLGRKIKKICRKIWKKEKDRRVRILAAIVLKELGEGSEDIEKAVLSSFEDSSVEIRRRAALLAGEVKTEEAFSRLAAVSKDPDTDVRVNVCRSLVRSRNPSSIPILKSLSRDRQPPVRKSAIQALAEIPEWNVETDVFLDALKDSDAAVRSSVLLILENKGDASIIPDLRKISENDPDLRVRTIAKKAIAVLSIKRP